MDVASGKNPVKIFCCYAREDQSLLRELRKHLKIWERLDLITVWNDTDITPGTDWKKEITLQLTAAHIILFLVSPDFLASDYCYSTEMKYAMERYEGGEEVHIIPIILRHCAWEKAPFGKMQALPANAKPIVDPGWGNQDEALLDVVGGIYRVIEQLTTKSPSAATLMNGSKSHPSPSVTRVMKRQSASPRLPTKGKSVTPSLIKGAAPDTSKLWLHPLVSNPTISSEILVRTFRGHTDAILDVVMTPDGRRIVSGSKDTTIKVWDAESGQELLTLSGYIEGNRGSDGIGIVRPRVYMQVQAVAIMPDGLHAVHAAGRALKVWNLTNGDEVCILRGHSGNVQAVVVTPDGQRIISGSADNLLKVWEAKSGEEIATLPGHAGIVGTLALTTDGEKVVSGSSDGSIRVWDLPTGKVLFTLVGRTKNINVSHSTDDKRRLKKQEDRPIGIQSLAVVPDGYRIVSGTEDGQIEVWDLKKRAKVLNLHHGYPNGVSAIAVTPDGRHIISGSYETLKVWDLESGAELRSHPQITP